MDGQLSSDVRKHSFPWSWHAIAEVLRLIFCLKFKKNCGADVAPLLLDSVWRVWLGEQNNTQRTEQKGGIGASLPSKKTK